MTAVMALMSKTAICRVRNQISSVAQVAAVFWRHGHVMENQTAKMVQMKIQACAVCTH